MKNWTTRLFAIVAIAVAMGSALVAGCPGGDDADDTTNTATPTPAGGGDDAS